MAGRTASTEAASASNARSLPAGPSSSIPIGRPSAERPAGRVTPGIPATLDGPVLRMKVRKVGTRAPFSSTVSSSPIGAAGSGVVGKIAATTSFESNQSA